jgi:hypothetical protein
MGGSHSFENQSVKETSIAAGMVHTLGLSVTECELRHSTCRPEAAAEDLNCNAMSCS